jgi:hypothetical protein
VRACGGVCLFCLFVFARRWWQWQWQQQQQQQQQQQYEREGRHARVRAKMHTAPHRTASERGATALLAATARTAIFASSAVSPQILRKVRKCFFSLFYPLHGELTSAPRGGRSHLFPRACAGEARARAEEGGGGAGDRRPEPLGVGEGGSLPPRGARGESEGSFWKRKCLRRKIVFFFFVNLSSFGRILHKVCLAAAAQHPAARCYT